MSAMYSESLFTLFSFSGMLLMHRQCSWWATALFACASATRSNGIVLIGFPFHRALCQRHGCSVRLLSKCLAQVLIIVTPFLVYQWYAYDVFCSNQHHTTWCDNHPLPLVYSHVQSTYWGVGPFRYFTWNQVSSQYIYVSSFFNPHLSLSLSLFVCRFQIFF